MFSHRWGVSTFMLYKYTFKWWIKGWCVIHLKKTCYVTCSSINKDSDCWETHAVGFETRISLILICYHFLLWVSHVLFLTFPFKFVYYVNGLVVFLNLRNLHSTVFIRLSRNCLLSEFIHVRCSEQINSFSSNYNEIHLLIGASLMIKFVFLFITFLYYKLTKAFW